MARLVASVVSPPCRDRQGDFICQYLALSCTLPYIIALYCIFKCHITRDVHDVLVCIGYGLNAVCSKVLKEILAQPRPRGTCSSLGTCDSHGMPSIKRKKKTFEEMRVISTMTVVEHTLLWILALSVCVARVHLGYHSVSQVIVGGILGVVCGYLWYLCVRYMYTRGILSRFLRITHGSVLLTHKHLYSAFD